MNKEQDMNEKPVKGYAISMYVPFDFTYSGEFKDLDECMLKKFKKNEKYDSRTWSDIGKKLFDSKYAGNDRILQWYRVDYSYLKDCDGNKLLDDKETGRGGSGQASKYKYKLNTSNAKICDLKVCIYPVRIWVLTTGRFYLQIGVYVQDENLSVLQLHELKKYLYEELGNSSSYIVPCNEENETNCKFNLTELIEALYRTLRETITVPVSFGFEEKKENIEDYIKINKMCASYLVFDKQKDMDWIQNTMKEYCGENAHYYHYKPNGRKDLVYTYMKANEFDMAVLSNNIFGYTEGERIEEYGLYQRFTDYFTLFYLYYDYLHTGFSITDDLKEKKYDGNKLYLADNTIARDGQPGAYKHFNDIFINVFCNEVLKLTNSTICQLQHYLSIYYEISIAKSDEKFPCIIYDKEECQKYPYFFISYSHKDYKKVYKILADMARKGINFVYDGIFAEEATATWKEKVFELMNGPNCIGVMFFVSENLFASTNVYKEIQLLNGDKILVEGSTYELSSPEKFLKKNKKSGKKIIRNYFSVNISEENKSTIILLRDTMNLMEEKDLNDDSYGTEWVEKIASTFHKDVIFVHSNSQGLIGIIEDNVEEIRQRTIEIEQQKTLEEVAITEIMQPPKELGWDKQN